ncbi:MAG TPA: MFS transporter [Bauldia sp.]|nr:MFS transporter [Bauldia sp.]
MSAEPESVVARMPVRQMAAPAFVRRPATWYGYFLIATQIYLFNVQGNVIPFLQEEFALSYRIVSLHSSAVALGVIITALFGRHITRPLGRRRSLWLGGGSIAAGAFLLCLSPGAWASIPSCLLIGLGGGVIPSVVPAILSDLHGEARRHAFAEQAIIAYSFAIVGPLVTGFSVAHGFGWRPAVILGGAIGVTLIVLFRSITIPEAHAAAAVTRRPLLPAFWAYCALLGFSCSFEFSVLLWSPSFLERVVGLTPAEAATYAAGFFVGVLAGRVALRALLHRFAPQAILLAAFATGVMGFLLYWGIATPWAAIPGIVMLGLCVAPQYPLTMALALGAADGNNDAAAQRLTLAFGLAVLLAPAVLGALADVVGLRIAHLTLPLLIAAALATFLTGQALSRRPAPSRSPA